MPRRPSDEVASKAAQAAQGREIVDLRGTVGAMSQLMTVMVEALSAGGIPLPQEVVARFSQATTSQPESQPEPQPEGPSTRESHSTDDRDLHDGMSRLYVDPDRAVGWGRLDRERKTLHSRDVPDGHVVVQVVVVGDDARDVRLPCPDKDEAETVGQAATTGCYVLWPYRLIDMV